MDYEAVLIQVLALLQQEQRLSYRSRAAPRTLVDRYLSEVSLLAKVLCPEGQVEANTESYEDEDGHVQIYPLAGFSEG